MRSSGYLCGRWSDAATMLAARVSQTRSVAWMLHWIAQQRE
jgi:hypothetical protein